MNGARGEPLGSYWHLLGGAGNYLAPEKKWMVGRLLSYWGPVTFQGRTVKLPGSNHPWLSPGVDFFQFYTIGPKTIVINRSYGHMAL